MMSIGKMLNPRASRQSKEFSIDPERASQIVEDFASYKKHYQVFQFQDEADGDFKTTNALYQEIARGMNEVSRLSSLPPVCSGRTPRSFIKSLIKRILLKFMRPLFKLALNQQQEMNRHTILLAQAVVALEARMALLEHQLNAAGQSH